MTLQNDACYDVIIMGTGVAGLYAAYHLDRRLRVLLLTKREATLCNSSLAQGGIAAVTDTSRDSIRKHINDTLVAGGFRNDRQAVEVLATEGPKEVARLIELGVDFDRQADGTLHLTLEGGHSCPRILHHQDCTGKEMVDRLLQVVLGLSNVTLAEHTVVAELQKTGNTFHLLALQEDTPVTLHCHQLIVASGGIGRVYEYTTNSAIATGDGISLAARLGARIKNLHYIQFHPTAFADHHTRESFLISESVRGEGAHLLNCRMERFMDRYDERLELAPRDVVSRSIMEEAKLTGSNSFYLDISHEDPEFVRTRFPMIAGKLQDKGIDMTRDPIPVFPCQHYLMGGIDVDLSSQTCVDGLYACGECSHTGVHGANRLASNSLLEAVVFSRRAAAHINARYSGGSPAFEDYTFQIPEPTAQVPHGIRTEIRALMQQAYFVTPLRQDAIAAFPRVCALRDQVFREQYPLCRDTVEVRALADVAYYILREVI